MRREKTPQGLVTVVAKVDDREAARSIKSANGVPIYQNASSLTETSILKWDLLFTIKGNDRMRNRAGPLEVFGAFNGLGAEERKKFPHDIEAQINALLNRIDFVGFSYNEKPTNSQFGELTLAVNGTFPMYLPTRYPPGTPLRATLPLPNEPNKSTRSVPKGKVTLIPVPETEEGFVQYVERIFRERKSERNNPTQNKRDKNVFYYEEKGSEYRMAKAFEDHELFNGVMFLYRLITSGVIEVPDVIDGPTSFVRERSSPEDFCVSLLHNLGLLRERSALTKNATEFGRVKNDLLDTLFYDGHTGGFSGEGRVGEIVKRKQLENVKRTAIVWSEMNSRSKALHIGTVIDADGIALRNI